MAVPVTIDRVMTLKTMRFEPGLIVGIEGDEEITVIEDFDRVHLYLDVPSEPETRGRARFDQTRRAVRQALNEAIRVARIINAPVSDYRLNFERIRAFASRYGGLWGVAIPDPLPRAIEGRRIDGSMLDWYRELSTLLDVYDLVAVASGKREDRALHNRVNHTADHQQAVFVSRGREEFLLAPRDREITIRAPWDDKPELVVPWQLVHGKSSALAWIILTAVCKDKLDHRINIGFHPSERNSLAITPDGIGPTLYALLWLDCLHQWRSLHHATDAEMVRLCQRPGCENRIHASARADARYCGGTCQKTDRRRLNRLTLTGV